MYLRRDFSIPAEMSGSFMSLALCTNKECPIKFSCRRALAQPSSRQSYTKFEYKEKEDGSYECDGHISLTKKELEFIYGKKNSKSI